MIKVLIVDDSALYAEMLKRKLSAVNGICIVGIAGDPYEARDRILELEPDVMTLDIEMPRMDGLKFLQKLMPQYPMPVIVVSSYENKSEDAIKAGAVSFHLKPAGNDDSFVMAVARDILKYGTDKSRIRTTAVSAPVYSRNGIELVALGASTGGTDALETVIKGLPADSPPVVVTQHMPPVFTKMYAERLDRTTSLSVYEGRDGMRLSKGMCVIAPGGYQMEILKDSTGYYVRCFEGEKVSGHCPSVDVMFRSVAKCAGKSCVAAILTGMGADGAEGLLQIKNTGAYTVGQNRETCVVYGMPMEAYKLGAVCDEAPLQEISVLLRKKMNY